MPFRISQERRAGVAPTLRLAGRLAGEAVEVLVDACAGNVAGVTIDLADVDFADDAGVRTLEEIKARGAILQGPKPYLALLLQREGTRGG